MKMRFALSIVLAIASALTLKSQSFQIKLTSNNQQIVEEAVKNAFCVVRQEFQLQDTKTEKRYDLDSLGYFGYTESVCLKVRNGYIADNAIPEPWNEDSRVADYPKYRPVLSSFRIYNPSSKEWEKARSQTYKDVTSIGNTKRIFVVDSLFNNEGLPLDNEVGDKEGWLVWVYQQGEQLSFQSFRQRNLSADSLAISNQPQQFPEKKLLSGIIVSADYSELGVVRFKLAALVEKFTDGWRCVSVKDLCKDKKEERRLVEVSESQLKASPEPVTEYSQKKKRK